jgi:hypothetical protein
MSTHDSVQQIKQFLHFEYVDDYFNSYHGKFPVQYNEEARGTLFAPFKEGTVQNTVYRILSFKFSQFNHGCFKEDPYRIYRILPFNISQINHARSSRINQINQPLMPGRVPYTIPYVTFDTWGSSCRSATFRSRSSLRQSGF